MGKVKVRSNDYSKKKKKQLDHMVLWEDIKETGSQEYGLDYDGFFSNVVKSSTIRYVIAVMKKKKEKRWHVTAILSHLYHIRYVVK